MDKDKIEPDQENPELIRGCRALRDRENSQLQPPPFSQISRQLKRVSVPERKPFTGRSAFRSAGWITAACVTGIIVEWLIPRPGKEMVVFHTLYDTIRTTDTVIKELQIPLGISPLQSSLLTRGAPPSDTTATPGSINPSASHYSLQESGADPDCIFLKDFYSVTGTPIDLQDSSGPIRGRSLAEEDFPFHLMAH